ncbi:MAG: hypothetical protein NTX53_09325 [candidate division WOR-3 bacterium]|nr:hypothetical protein [candidate division WOR-3 bacterium]
MGRRTTSFIAAVATVVGSLALVRLADAVGKRELMRAALETDVEAQVITRQYDSLQAVRQKLAQDEQFLNYRIASLSRREPYLVINRADQKLTLALQDKTILETKFRLWLAKDEEDEFAALPRATLEVLSKEVRTTWCRPDWLYRLEGVAPAPDSASRCVRDAFGAGAIYLGGNLVIHGRVSDEVPPEAIDHTYIELDSMPLKTIVDAVKPGTLVLIK